MIKDLVLAKEWLPAAYSHDLTDQPLQVTILEERVVLFRTSNAIKAFKDLCIHRGASVIFGKVVDDCIVCPYHGWKYDDAGAMVKNSSTAAGKSYSFKKQKHRCMTALKSTGLYG